MLRPGFDMRDPIFFQLRLKPAGAAPSRVLPTIVRQHLLRWLELAHGDSIHFDNRLSRGTAEQIRTHDEPRVIIHEGDEVGILATQPEREDVRLPHLIRRRPLEEPGSNHVPPFGRRRCGHQLHRVQLLPHGLRTRRQEENPPQHLTDPFDAERGILLLQLDDLLGDGGG
jgi:hypothetical protein